MIECIYQKTQEYRSSCSAEGKKESNGKSLRIEKERKESSNYWMKQVDIVKKQ
jgi:hypothetical protein